MRTLFAVILVLCVCGYALTSQGSDVTAAAVTCDRTLSPGGSVSSFLASLTTGQTGCLKGGSYTGSVNFPQTDKITLASVPGERATITASKFEIYRGGDDQVIRDITLVGTTASAPTFQINGNRAVVDNVLLTNNHQAQSCIDVGYYPVTGFTLHASTIHGCGQATNGNHDHGIYVEGVDGGTISDNTFFDNYGGWDIQAWPHANVTVERNIMRAAPQATEGGLIIAGGSTSALVVRNNTMVGNGKASMFDSYQLATGAATASNNCLVPNGSPIYESRWVNGGYVTRATEADCGTPTPTPTPTQTPTVTPTPTDTPPPCPTPVAPEPAGV